MVALAKGSRHPDPLEAVPAKYKWFSLAPSASLKIPQPDPTNPRQIGR